MSKGFFFASNRLFSSVCFLMDRLPEGNIAASSGAYSYGIAQMSALLSRKLRLLPTSWDLTLTTWMGSR